MFVTEKHFFVSISSHFAKNVFYQRYSYNTIINTAAKNGDPATAVECLTKMENANLTPSVMTFSSVLDAFASRGDTKEVQRWWGRMLAARISPTTATYNAVVKTLSRISVEETEESQHTIQENEVQSNVEQPKKQFINAGQVHFTADDLEDDDF